MDPVLEILLEITGKYKILKNQIVYHYGEKK